MHVVQVLLICYYINSKRICKSNTAVQESCNSLVPAQVSPHLHNGNLRAAVSVYPFFDVYARVNGTIGAELSSLCHTDKCCVGLRSAQFFIFDGICIYEMTKKGEIQ